MKKKIAIFIVVVLLLTIQVVPAFAITLTSTSLNHSLQYTDSHPTYSTSYSVKDGYAKVYVYHGNANIWYWNVNNNKSAVATLGVTIPNGTHGHDYESSATPWY